ncbi:hypothetical protein [Oricola cellulosilytica]|uniref:Uncharacterized protein n=1 Tax=Oricola cellulosilytica TaxID=1429082 RepID=A0A4R0PDH7_9HYPH|nr:hypothetical protein [Oricola cellulosilytica]TCD14265.1 hypothetical protein E0D97_09295 [Oricola cellulosilytica]
MPDGEIRREDLPPLETPIPGNTPSDRESIVGPPPSDAIPLPEPFRAKPGMDPENPLAIPGQDGVEQDGGLPQGGEPVIGGDVEDLPPPVQRMREMIMQAARDADFEALRPLIGSGADMTQLSLGGYEGDPIAYIRDLSGDTKGHEILAILLEVLEAGYAIYDPGTPNEIFVWPYFVATSLDELTPKQRVELFKLVTSGDYEDMRAFGAYIFYRVGISPDGRWRFFVAGD